MKVSLHTIMRFIEDTEMLRETVEYVKGDITGTEYHKLRSSICRMEQLAKMFTNVELTIGQE